MLNLVVHIVTTDFKILTYWNTTEFRLLTERWSWQTWTSKVIMTTNLGHASQAKCSASGFEVLCVSLRTLLLIYCRDGVYRKAKHTTGAQMKVLHSRWAGSYPRFETSCCLHVQCRIVQDHWPNYTALHRSGTETSATALWELESCTVR
jgi:hypothetical protein